MTIQSLDAQLLLFINHDLANPIFDVLMPALTLKGYLLVLPFLFSMLASGYAIKNDAGKNRLVNAAAPIVIACLAMYCSGFVEDWMKDFIGRVRPCRTLEDVRLILPCPQSYSLPSGHAISSFSFAVPLWYLTHAYMGTRWRTYPVILASLIAFSRIYLGVHYPADVLVGGILGGTIGLVFSVLYQAIIANKFMKT